jgi:hypothetical protein
MEPLRRQLLELLDRDAESCYAAAATEPIGGSEEAKPYERRTCMGPDRLLIVTPFMDPSALEA